MAVVTKIEYPSTGSPTATFSPTLEPDWQNSNESVDEGIQQDQSSGNTEYRYKEGLKIKTIKRAFRNMADADRSALQTFLTTVGGELVKFTDWDASTHTVSFASFKTDYRPREGVRWDFDVVMREEL